MGKGEQPQSANLLGNELQSLGDYLRRQESSEKVIVSRGQCFRTSRNRAGEGDGSLACAEECTERTSEKEQLKRQVVELQAEVDRLSQQLASTHITNSEADLSSDQVSESLSRVEDAMLMRSQSLPEQLVTAHKKIEVLEVTDAIALICFVCSCTGATHTIHTYACHISGCMLYLCTLVVVSQIPACIV